MLKAFKRSPKLFTLRVQYTHDWNREVVVIGKTTSPTVDFYFRNRSHQVQKYTEIDISRDDCLAQLATSITRGCLIVLVRDVPLSILKHLADANMMCAGVVWFFDDDIPGAHLDQLLPKPYRKSLSSWYKKASPLLTKLCNKIWVSTAHLAEKYQLPAETVLPPCQILKEKRPLVRCFYHGSSSHQEDWKFVLNVTRKVQSRNLNTWFELIGDHSLYKAVRGIPRVQVIHPMPWPDYLTMTASRTMDIGLAPLMNTSFNHSRSHTKLIDICRQKAVGVYSDRFPLSKKIEESNAGLVVDDRVDSWVEAIEYLMQLDKQDMLNNANQLVLDVESLSRVLSEGV
ncbi:hypothetical protein [Endozoicomonas sp. SESOKO2]|uniref:hypothetical protein n=1 Tax=Endozoicomonas sp. SESOKO2 TaxID=2828743 RepID=UPI0021485CD8|nr:hypothetical protein [Endozoicomonas sp. SESOKO2]